MLILTRKLGQAIKIGENITVSVIDVKGKQVRLGIQAPDDVTVHREEVYQLIQQQNILAQTSKDFDDKELSNVWNRIMGVGEEDE